MGQYHILCNLDKKECVIPHAVGDGLKLWEMAGWSIGGIATAMVLLTSHGERRGGGDFSESEVWGRWHGDRIAIIGDYAEDPDLPLRYHASKIYDAATRSENGWTDISAEVRDALATTFNLEYSGDGWMSRREI